MNTATAEVDHIVNGVSVTYLMQTINAVQQTPDVAMFQFRATNQWKEGGFNRTTIQGFHGACVENERPAAFSLSADEPPVLLGQDQAPNPVEYLLTALVSCVTTSMVYHAAARGINIRAVSSTIEGDLNLHGFLGLDDSVRKGFTAIRMYVTIEADGSQEELDELVQLGPQFSPVFDTLTHGTDVRVERRSA